MESPENLKDPLVNLPCCSTILDYRKGQVVYAQQDPAASVYLILQGYVKITKTTAEGRQVVIDIYGPEEFFGESALLNLPRREDQATAMDDTKVMVWTAPEFTEIVVARPGLAMGMLQVFVSRLNAFSQRVESLAQDNVLERLGRSLIRFADRMGQPGEDGSVRIPALAHTLQAQYVGTSREIVTHYMNEFRTRGFLTYSRKEIIIYGDRLKQWLESDQFLDMLDKDVPDPAQTQEADETVTVRQLLGTSPTRGKSRGGARARARMAADEKV